MSWDLAPACVTGRQGTAARSPEAVGSGDARDRPHQVRSVPTGPGAPLPTTPHRSSARSPLSPGLGPVGIPFPAPFLPPPPSELPIPAPPLPPGRRTRHRRRPDARRRRPRARDSIAVAGPRTVRAHRTTGRRTAARRGAPGHMKFHFTAYNPSRRSRVKHADPRSRRWSRPTASPTVPSARGPVPGREGRCARRGAQRSCCRRTAPWRRRRNSRTPFSPWAGRRGYPGTAAAARRTRRPGRPVPWAPPGRGVHTGRPAPDGGPGHPCWARRTWPVPPGR